MNFWVSTISGLLGALIAWLVVKGIFQIGNVEFWIGVGLITGITVAVGTYNYLRYGAGK